jgi:hypothetical protein
MAILTSRRLDRFVHDKRTKTEAFRVGHQEKHVDVHGARKNICTAIPETVEGDTATVYKVVCGP